MKSKIILSIMLLVLITGSITITIASYAEPNSMSIKGTIIDNKIIKNGGYAYTRVKINISSYNYIQGRWIPPSKDVNIHISHDSNNLSEVSKISDGYNITATLSYTGDENGGYWDATEVKIDNNITNIEKDNNTQKIEDNNTTKDGFFSRLLLWIKSIFG